MNKDDIKSIESPNEEESCGASLETHIVDVWVGLAAVGLGNCREVYRALLEMAEAIKTQGKFQTYVPQGGDFVPNTVKAAMVKAQAEFKRRQQAQETAQRDSAQQGDASFMFPDDLKSN